MAKERLEVELIAEASKAISELQKYVTATGKATEQVEKHAKQTKTAGEKIGGLTKTVKSYGIEMAAVGIGVVSAIRTMSRFVDAASESESALAGIKSAMVSNNVFTEQGLKLYESYANQIMRMTAIDDEAILSLMQLGTNMGVSSEKMKQATEFAIGLSKTFGIDVNTAMRGVALAMEGQFTLLSRYIPALREAETEEEKMAAFQKVASAGYLQSQDALKTYAGQMQSVRTAIEEIQEAMGKKLIPIITEVLGWVQKAIDWFNNLSPPMQNIITTVGLITAGLVAFAPAIIAIIALAPALGAAITIATGPFGIIIAAVAALAVGIVMLIKHWDDVSAFFKNLWQTLKEFWDKIEPWVAMFVPIYGIPKTIIENWKPIVGFFTGIGDAIQAFADRFLAIVERIGAIKDQFVGFFKDAYDKLVGHSIIPEMVTGIESEFKRLADYMEKDFQPSFAMTMESVWGSTSSIGKGIKDTLKNLIADLIRAFARQYAAIAAAFLITFQFGKAARYFAASAALFAAAGAIRKLQQGGIKRQVGGNMFGDRQPAMLEAGERVMSKEVSRANAAALNRMEAGEGGGAPVNIYLGGKLLYSTMQRAFRNGQIVVDARAIR